MSKNRNWVSEVTPEIQQKIVNAAKEAYKNGFDILIDAELLLNSNRYPRACALLILAEEEFSKAFILLICANEKRWDSEILKTLRKHPEKLGISNTMRAHFEKVINSCNKDPSIQNIESTFMPSDEELKIYEQKLNLEVNSREKDYLKQECFYIGIDKHVNITSTPNKIEKSIVTNLLKETNVFKTVVEVTFGDFSNLNNYTDLT